MSQTTPHSPRHALADQVEPPTTAIPVLAPAEIPGEFTDDATQAIPVIPAQRPVSPPRTAPPSWPSAPSMPAQRRPGDDRLAAQGPPAGVYPVTTVPPAPRRRVLPAVLAGVTACLLAAGIVVGVGGAAGTDMTDPPSTSATP